MTLDTFFPSIRVKDLNTGKEEKLMDDKQILDLYWERSEEHAISKLQKNTKYCRYIASNILHNDEDSESL